MHQSASIRLIHRAVEALLGMLAHVVAQDAHAAEFPVERVKLLNIVQAALCEERQVSLCRLAAQPLIGVLIPLRIVALRPAAVDVAAVIRRVANVHTLAARILLHQADFLVDHALALFLERLDVVVEVERILRRPALAPLDFRGCIGILQVFRLSLRAGGVCLISASLTAFVIRVDGITIDVAERPLIVRLSGRAPGAVIVIEPGRILCRTAASAADIGERRAVIRDVEVVARRVLRPVRAVEFIVSLEAELVAFLRELRAEVRVRQAVVDDVRRLARRMVRVAVRAVTHRRDIEMLTARLLGIPLIEQAKLGFRTLVEALVIDARLERILCRLRHDVAAALTARRWLIVRLAHDMFQILRIAAAIVVADGRIVVAAVLIQHRAQVLGSCIDGLARVAHIVVAHCPARAVKYLHDVGVELTVMALLLSHLVQDDRVEIILCRRVVKPGIDITVARINVDRTALTAGIAAQLRGRIVRFLDNILSRFDGRRRRIDILIRLVPDIRHLVFQASSSTAHHARTVVAALCQSGRHEHAIPEISRMRLDILNELPRIADIRDELIERLHDHTLHDRAKAALALTAVLACAVTEVHVGRVRDHLRRKDGTGEGSDGCRHERRHGHHAGRPRDIAVDIPEILPGLVIELLELLQARSRKLVIDRACQLRDILIESLPPFIDIPAQVRLEGILRLIVQIIRRVADMREDILLFRLQRVRPTIVAVLRLRRRLRRDIAIVVRYIVENLMVCCVIVVVGNGIADIPDRLRLALCIVHLHLTLVLLHTADKCQDVMQVLAETRHDTSHRISRATRIIRII